MAISYGAGCLSGIMDWFHTYAQNPLLDCGDQWEAIWHFLSAEREPLKSLANMGLPMEWLAMPHILGDKVYKSLEGSASSVCPFQSRLSFWVVHTTLESFSVFKFRPQPSNDN